MTATLLDQNISDLFFGLSLSVVQLLAPLRGSDLKKALAPLYSSYVYVLPWLLLCTTLNVIWLKKNRANFATGDIFDDHLWVCILCNFFRTNAISNRLIIEDHFEWKCHKKATPTPWLPVLLVLGKFCVNQKSR